MIPPPPHPLHDGFFSIFRYRPLHNKTIFLKDAQDVARFMVTVEPYFLGLYSGFPHIYMR